MHLRNIYDKETLKKKLAQEKFKRVTISFYQYVEIQDPRGLRDELYREWTELGVLGRIYVSFEGINAQLNVPEHNFDAFRNCVDSREEFRGVPFKVGLEQRESFLKLTIKVKEKIVADGLSLDAYDLKIRGKHLKPEEFNRAMESPETIVVDMRNQYESRIGHFEKALTPDADTFREELSLVKEILKGREDEKLLLYCTGGIRCEKASSYLIKQGFQDVNQLEGGIINYGHAVKEGRIENRFRGKNFVFDERLKEKVSDDILADCDICGQDSDNQINCANVMCHLLFIQCQDCAKELHGCCSKECLEVALLPEKEQRVLRKGNQHPTAKHSTKQRLRPKFAM